MKRLLFYSLTIILLMIILAGQGFLGSSVDICAYKIIGNSNFRLGELIGGRLATLTYKSNYIAPYFTSTLLFISFFFYINKILKKLSNYGKSKILTASQREIYSVLITTSSILIWPFYPYLINALRQGVAISFTLILMNIKISDNFKFKNFFFLLTSLLLAFSHKSGLFFVFSIGFCSLQNLLLNKTNFHINRKIIILITTIIGVFGILELTPIGEHGGLKTIGFDLGIPLMLFSIITIIILLTKYNIHKSIFPSDLFNINLFFSILIIFVYKNSLVSERFFPYLLIAIFPIILEIFVFNFKQTIVTIFIFIFLGFNVTFLSGQYISSLKHSIEYGRWCSKIN
tara:strand:+ start:21368 stop:22396 length:1029 start_codon:yes stop_codon:yes gene_type:complete